MYLIEFIHSLTNPSERPTGPEPWDTIFEARDLLLAERFNDSEEAVARLRATCSLDAEHDLFLGLIELRNLLHLGLHEPLRATAQRVMAHPLYVNAPEPLVRASVAVRIGSALDILGDSDEAIRLTTEARYTFEAHGWHHEAGLAMTQIATMLRKRGDVVGATTLFLQAVDILDRYGTERESSLSRFMAGAALRIAENYTLAEEVLSDVLERPTLQAPTVIRVECLQALAVSRKLRGDLERAEPLYHELAELAERLGLHESVVRASAGLADLKRRQGDLTSAVDILNRITDDDLVRTSVRTRVEVRNIKAHLLALSGDQEEAARVFVEARDLLDDSTMYELRMDLLRVGMEFLTDPALRLSVAEELVQLLTVHVRNVPDSIRSIIELRGIYEQEKTKAEVVRQQELTRTIVETQERSLREIGRDLHDSLGQDLTVVVRMADVVRKRCANADPETVDLLDAIHAASQRAASDARRISHLVSGSGVTASTLQSLLSDLVEVTRKAVPELDIECIVVGTVEDLADDVARTIYRATQTLVQNVIRHAKAHSCTVQVVVDSKQTTLIVEDDGVGLDVETTDRGLGLREVEARLALVGGWVRIDGAPGRGVEVHCIIPR